MNYAKADYAINIIKSITKLDKIQSIEELKKSLKSIAIPSSLESSIDINKYWDLMDQNPISIIPGSIYGVNLGSEAIKDVADLVINTAIDSLCLIDGPKILVIDEIIKVLGPYCEDHVNSVLEKCKKNNSIIMSTIDTDDYVEKTRNKKTKLWTLMRDNFDLEIIMHHESTFYDLKDIFGLTEVEEGELFATKDNRSFVMKPNGYKSAIGELNISNLSYYISILSPNEQTKKLIADLINKTSDPKVFLPEIYANLQRLK